MCAGIDSIAKAKKGSWITLAEWGYSEEHERYIPLCVKTEYVDDEIVVMCAGIDSIAKAKKGSWITLAEWGYSEEHERYIPLCVKTEYVDDEIIKADTWYKLKNGEFTEV